MQPNSQGSLSSSAYEFTRSIINLFTGAVSCPVAVESATEADDPSQDNPDAEYTGAVDDAIQVEVDNLLQALDEHQ